VRRYRKVLLKRRLSGVWAAAIVLLTVLACTGIALAATITGSDSNNVIYGGSADDTIDGKGGADALYGQGARTPCMAVSATITLRLTSTIRSQNRM
jgi:hypothetical protein